VLFITALNPIDLGRICVMLKMDIAALMGYTGALYRHFFGTGAGIIYILLLMLLWIIVPLLAAVRIFQKKNL
jgi:Cu-processing system permease protein